ncbi:MAG: hypothetical protein IPK79_13500 [Vampirovibrionales bacterium]|nr:hypothetical protein [Vampirovibrionales bacterium]
MTDEEYNAMPRKAWDRETPLYSEGYDEYFFSEDALNEFTEDNECSIESLRLVICEPNRFRKLDDCFLMTIYRAAKNCLKTWGGLSTISMPSSRRYRPCPGRRVSTRRTCEI